MYKLYWAESTGAFVVHAALNECGAKYELVPLDYDNNEHKKEPYTKINPTGEIPALILPDGTVLTETVAMTLHLAEAFPDAGLLPPLGTSERAMAYRWLLYMATNTYMHDLRYYYPERYTMNEGQADGVKTAGLALMERSLGTLDDALKGQSYLAGTQMSIADTYLGMMSMWHPDGDAYMDKLSNVQRVVNAVKSRPSMTEVWHLNFPESQSND
ncbi:MAG: hypothetical protein GKR96_00285 [Gammaproteobacteria bacterium]|nr:hypothetical protein [Gammaproteobacteria bacterium]